MRSISCSIVTILLAVGSLPVLAQSPLRLGETIRGRLTSKDKTLDDGSYYQLYEFRARRGQRLNIELHATGFEPYLTLFDRDGTEVISTRDLSGDGTAKIEITVPYSGAYLMRINSVRKDEAGSFAVLVK